MLLLMFGIVASNFTYNNLGFKNVAVLDLLNQTGYLLVFVLASWLCDVPQLNWAAMLFGALFAMQSHVFGQLMDIDQDKKAGRNSTAILIGTQLSKLLLALLMLLEALISLLFFSGIYVASFMFCGFTFFVIDAVFGPRRYPLWFVKAFFIGWNLVVVSTIYFIWRDGIFLLSAG